LSLEDVRRCRIFALLIVGAATVVVAVWLRERRSRRVFPAHQADALLNPARRLMQSPKSMVQTFGIAEGQRVLELGPGPGFFTKEAARVVGPTGAVICIDLQRGMVDALHRHLPEESKASVRAVVGSAMQLPLASASIDNAFMVAVLGEVPDPVATLTELNRVLRAGGALSIGEMLTDPDYIRQPVLRRRAWDAGLRYTGKTRQPFGYVMHFAAT
jgi:ubiquinone/menaquinone biosynthesis C-methylase UbiE